MECVLIRHKLFVRINCSAELSVWRIKCSLTVLFKIFCWTKVHFVGPLIAPILDFMWPSPWVSKPRWFCHLHMYLLACSEPKGHVWCCTCLSINRGVHCISMFTAGLPSGHPSCKQQTAGNSGISNLGSPLNKPTCYPLFYECPYFIFTPSSVDWRSKWTWAWSATLCWNQRFHAANRQPATCRNQSQLG